MILETLSLQDSAAVLMANYTASLACVGDGRPYVVPITYAVSGGVIYSFSLEGCKLRWMRANPYVSLLVVEHGQGATWTSVVVTGLFEELTEDPSFDGDNDFAWKALSKRADRWDPGSLKPEGLPQVGDYIYY